MSSKLSASQAAKMVGKSVPTITRAIKKGKLSAEKTEDGGYLIDPSEVLRVWDAAAACETPRNGNATGEMLRHETLKVTDETGVLQAKLEAAEARLEDMRETVDDLRRRLDQEGEDRRAAQARLEDLRDRMTVTPSQEAEKSPSGGFWSIFRRKGAQHA